MISTIKYRETIFEHPDLTKITGVLTYKTLHLLQNETKTTVIAVHSNLGGGKHGYLGLVVRLTAYALLTNNTFVCQVHPVKISIPIAATHHVQEELKHQYNENI